MPWKETIMNDEAKADSPAQAQPGETRQDPELPDDAALLI
jgi:hypothetical protein